MDMYSQSISIWRIGIEMTFSQNVASRFLLTKNLAPIFEDARVINCLGAGNGGDVDLDDIQLAKKDGMLFFVTAASQYATINDLLVKEFATRYGKQAKFFHFFPGVVNTDSVANQHFPWILQFGAKWVLPWIADSPSKTAETLLKIVTNKSYGAEGNLGPRGLPVKLSRYILDHPESGKVLWDYLDKLTCKK